MPSLIKYYDKQENCRGNLYWGRANDDGAPFRGKKAPLLRDNEFEKQAERVEDGHVEIFDLSDPEQKKRYEEILDAAINQWYTIYFRDWKYSEKRDTWLVLVEWSEAYMEIPDKQR